MGISRCLAAYCKDDTPTASWDDITEEDKAEAKKMGDLMGEKALGILKNLGDENFTHRWFGDSRIGRWFQALLMFTPSGGRWSLIDYINIYLYLLYIWWLNGLNKHEKDWNMLPLRL